MLRANGSEPSGTSLLLDIDTTGDGSFDSTSPCHTVDTTGLAGGQTSVMPCSCVWRSRKKSMSARWSAEPAPV